MYNVSTNEYHDEFVEIFNLSAQDSIDITGWTFSDSSGIDKILPHKGGVKIGPRNYALILDGSYFNNSTTYDTLMADSLIILKIGDNSFGKNGLSNSSPELLTIYDSSGTVLTRYRYSIGNEPGYSDEKIDLDGKNDSQNWDVSRIEGGTPGKKNSVSPALYDFGFDEESIKMPSTIFSDEVFVFTLEVFNFGLATVTDSLEIIIFSDQNRDRIFQEDELLISHLKLPAIAQKIDFMWEYQPTGEHLVVFRLFFPEDEVPENNVIVRTIRIIDKATSLHINEIKFLTDEDEPEWIELVNTGQKRVLLKDWSIADLSDTVSIDSSRYLDSGEFVVISEDSLPKFYQLSSDKMIILPYFLLLNDAADELILFDPAGNLKEEIQYEKEWLEGESFRSPSLERINPLLNGNKSENWGPSITPFGATPGEKNSIFSDLSSTVTSAIASPNPFSPNGDGIDDVTIISGEIPETSARIKAEVYDIRGRLIQTLVDNRFIGSFFNLVWDGRDKMGRFARIGIYIIFIQVLNDRLGVLREMKTMVTLAQKL